MNKKFTGFCYLFFFSSIFCMEENTLVPMQRAYKKMYQNAIKSFDSDINFYTSQLKELSRLGYSPAQYELARFNYYQKDLSSAEMYLRLAADKGLPQAQFEYGMKLLDQREVFKGLIYIEGAAEDRSVSVKSERGYSTIKTLGDKYAKAVLEDVKNGFIRVQDRKTDGLEFKKLVFATKQIENNETNDSSGQDNFKIEELSKDEELKNISVDPLESIVNLINDGNSFEAFGQLVKLKNLSKIDSSHLQEAIKGCEQTPSILGMLALLTPKKSEKIKFLLRGLDQEANETLYKLYAKQQPTIPTLIGTLLSKNFINSFKNENLNGLISSLKSQDLQEILKISGLSEWVQTEASVENQNCLGEYFIKFDTCNGKKAKWRALGFELLKKNEATKKLSDLLDYALNEKKALLIVELLECLSLLPNKDMSKLKNLKDKIYKVLLPEAKKNSELAKRFVSSIQGSNEQILFDLEKLFPILKNIHDTSTMLLCAQIANKAKGVRSEEYIKKAYKCAQESNSFKDIISFSALNLDYFSMIYNCDDIPDELAAKALQEYIVVQIDGFNTCARPENALYVQLRGNTKRSKNPTINALTNFIDAVSILGSSKNVQVDAKMLEKYNTHLDFFYNSNFFQQKLNDKPSNDFFLEYFAGMNNWLTSEYMKKFQDFSENKLGKSATQLCLNIVSCIDKLLLCREYVTNEKTLYTTILNQLEFSWLAYSHTKEEALHDKIKLILEDLKEHKNLFDEILLTKIDDIRFAWLRTNIENHLPEILKLFEELVENEHSVYFQHYYALAIAYEKGNFFSIKITDQDYEHKKSLYAQKALEVGSSEFIKYILNSSIEKDTGHYNNEKLQELFPAVLKCKDIKIQAMTALNYCFHEDFQKAEELLMVLENHEVEKLTDIEVSFYKLLASTLVYYNKKEYKAFCETFLELINQYEIEEKSLQHYKVKEKLKVLYDNAELENEINELALEGLKRYDTNAKNCVNLEERLNLQKGFLQKLENNPNVKLIDSLTDIYKITFKK